MLYNSSDKIKQWIVWLCWWFGRAATLRPTDAMCACHYSCPTKKSQFFRPSLNRACVSSQTPLSFRGSESSLSRINLNLNSLT